MLRSDSQVALNEVIVVCKATADGYRDAAEMTEEAELVGLFKKLSQERNAMAEALTTHVRQLGELPDAPDPDRETLENVVTRIKSALSADERLPLLEKCEQDEKTVLERTRVALELDLSMDTLAVLRKLQRDVTRALERLTQEKTRL